MYILDSPYKDPHFNIAAEEYLLKETDREYAFFYANDPSIIIGKHQNAWAEINIPWTRKNNIPVVRRISGGGTVWHDPGNLNFSFILKGEEGKLVNFREYAAPVLDFLRGIGVPAEFGDRNEMLVEGLKISGNAEHVWRKRVLHHGTMLFSADLSKLEDSLDTDPERYRDKAVQSVRSKTANICEFLDPTMDVTHFRKKLLEHISGFFEGIEIYLLDKEDKQRIQQLVTEKYSKWKWNIGYSPRYSLERDLELAGRKVHAELLVEKGQIKECRLEGDGGLLGGLPMQLIGLEHDPDSLKSILRARKIVDERLIDNFVDALF